MNKALALSLATLLMAGCNDKHAAGTQVAAKVNNDEISVHQVNNALARIPGVSPANADQAHKQVLDKLVNEELAVQQAEDLKLDRSPEVMMMIDSAKREILTRAYLRQITAGLPKPSEEDARKFYNEHPQLFAERRIYKVDEIAVQNPHPPIADLQKRVAGKSMTDIAADLKKDNIAFTSSSGTRAAEQISLPVLSELAKLKDGQTAVLQTPQAALIVHVDSSQQAPVNEDVALQRIPQFLANEKANAAIREKLAQLRSQAKIEYMDGTPPAAHTATGITATDSHPAAEENSQKVAEVKNNTGTASSIERGIAGFK